MNTSLKALLIAGMTVVAAVAGHAREYHVSVNGNNAGTGTETSPFRTIMRAAEVAYAGDVITVHAGVYREWVNPPRGGESDDRRIVYRAAAGERVEIKGSERITEWQREQGDVWKVVLPNSFFGDYNPYADSIVGDWFWSNWRIHHTGDVFLNGKSLYEKETLAKVYNPVADTTIIDPEGSTYVWHCETDANSTTIRANFHRFNPNKEEVEISARRTCFYPSKPGINYITIQGFRISQAATQWAAPTAEQVGMVATHWNKGWIIENNVISNSRCSGITLGKERGTGHNVWLADQSIDGSLHYIEVTFRTLRNGWSRENIGSHIVRNNEIFACEQTAICGSMGAAFSVIENNHIHDIHVKRQFSGAEIAGIKFHAAIDTKICNNRIHRATRGIWCDWMAQGTWISRNLFYDNDWEDIFFEVDHGPYTVENNIFGSPVNVWDMSQGGAYIHNIFAGAFQLSPEKSRYTPYHLPHSTDVAGLSVILNGDARLYNNVFLAYYAKRTDLAYGTVAYDKGGYPSYIDGNVYFGKAQPSASETHKAVFPDFDTKFRIEPNGKGVSVSFLLPENIDVPTLPVTTERLGKSKLARQQYEQPDGSPIPFDTDYSGVKRPARPAAGAVEHSAGGAVNINIKL